MSQTKYIIQCQQNSNYCIGVTQPSAQQTVILSFLQGAGNPSTQWTMDPNTGLIRLAADPNLCLDVQGTVIQGSQLIISPYVLGRQSQAWNWLGNPPYISNNASGQMVIDNSGGDINPNNPILVWPQDGGANQKWTMLAVPAVEAFLSRLKTENAGSPSQSVSREAVAS
jgi:hypothetical protein